MLFIAMKTFILLLSFDFLVSNAFVTPLGIRRPRTNSLRSSTAVDTFGSTNEMFGSTLSPELAEPVVSQFGFLGTIFQNGEVWSVLIMLAVVSLLLLWEETIRLFRTKLPPLLMPVVDSMLAEMGGLGFIGLFLGVFVTGGPIGRVLEAISETFLGDEEFLLESFEFLHTAVFEAGISFFMVAGLTVLKVLKKLESLTDVSAVIFDQNADGNVCLEELATALKVDSVQVDFDNDGCVTEFERQEVARRAKKIKWLEEANMNAETIKAEALVVRERLIQTGQVPASFRIEDYFVKVFAKNLEEIVELSPLIWLPLVPFISIGRSVDVSKHIVSASAPNAFEACGDFLTNPVFMPLGYVFMAFSLVWCLVNFWKLTCIKEMLLPVFIRDSSSGGDAVLLPPRYEDKQLLKQFNSSPNFIGWAESLIIETKYTGNGQSNNAHCQLFGKVGEKGPEIYLNSIKYHTWLVVSQIVWWGTQIVARDAEFLLAGYSSPPGTNVPLEFGIFSFFVALSVAQLGLAPQTFLNYCLVTSIEELTKQDMFEQLCEERDRDESLIEIPAEAAMD